MSIDRIPAALYAPTGAPARPSSATETGPGVARSRAEHAPPSPVATPATPATPAPSRLARAEPALPAEAPPGTDPALWSVLTGEERAFFAKRAAMGPLTYGRLKAELAPAPAPVARGARLDIRA